MKKILIIRFSSIGDIVLTTPVVRCLKQQYKEPLELHYITKKPFAFLVENNPYVDKVHTIDESISEVAEELKGIGFDHLVDLHNNIRSTSLKKRLGVPATTVNKLNVRKWVYVNLKWNVMPDVHIVDRYQETVAGLGIKNDGKGLDYFIPPQDEVLQNTLPVAHQGGYMACGIGGQFEGKKMPTSKIISLLTKLHKPVVLLGGKEDESAANEIVKAVGASVISLCGELNMNQSASVVKQARMVISHDTAIMHIATAFKKNVISLWGQTVPEFGMYPYLPGEHSLIVEPEGVKGRPVSKLGNRQQTNHVMNAINEQTIIDHVNRHF